MTVLCSQAACCIGKIRNISEGRSYRRRRRCAKIGVIEKMGHVPALETCLLLVYLDQNPHKASALSNCRISHHPGVHPSSRGTHVKHPRRRTFPGTYIPWVLMTGKLRMMISPEKLSGEQSPSRRSRKDGLNHHFSGGPDVD